MGAEFTIALLTAHINIGNAPPGLPHIARRRFIYASSGWLVSAGIASGITSFTFLGGKTLQVLSGVGPDLVAGGTSISAASVSDSFVQSN
jgi:hypothetical protein